ncbi:MAG: ferrochelatase [Chloroflexi bacterium]|nr:ferrochelatase [Chloroflexota bacterium]
MSKYIGQQQYEHGAPGRTGILLVNLGTPEAPTARGLRPYLRQFLSDPRVIEWPAWAWKPILHGIILNVRPKKSAKLYAAIWTEAGSPLFVYSQSIARQMQAALTETWGDAIRVELAMRYGRPSIPEQLAALRQANAQRILVLPLFPQYSATTTATIFDVVFDELKRWRWTPELRTITGYHDHPLYIRGLAGSVQRFWAENGRAAKLLFSFHGIPQSYFANGDPYPCFCQKTVRLVAEELGLDKEAYQVCFQSRFGPQEWLQPYTDKTLEAWAQAGLTSVDTICPGFAADCLETLEEVAVQNRDIFMAAGGRQYQYIPCLNDGPEQIALLGDLVQTHLQGWPVSLASDS